MWLVVFVRFIFQSRSHVSQFDSRLFVVVAGVGTSFVPDLHHQPPDVQLTSARICMSPCLCRTAGNLFYVNPFLFFAEDRTSNLKIHLLTFHTCYS